MSPTLESNMRSTTTQFMQAWESWQVEPVMAVRAPECVMLQYPASLNIPARNNDDFRSWFKSVENMLSNCKMTEHDYFASTEARRAWLHCSMTADRLDRTGGLYEMEYMFVLSFDGEGQTITKIVEMVDSHGIHESWSKNPEVKFERK